MQWFPTPAFLLALSTTPLAGLARLARRLLRNRVSAQQARERKKQYVTSLEEQIREQQVTQLGVWRGVPPGGVTHVGRWLSLSFLLLSLISDSGQR